MTDLDADPHADLDVGLARAEAMLDARRPEHAERLARSLVAAHPESAAVHTLLADALLAAGRGEEAVAPAREALRLEPDRASLHVDLCQALCVAGRHEEAATHGRHAVELAPHAFECHYALARALVEGALPGRLAEGLAAAHEAVRLAPHDASAHNVLGMAHQHDGDRDAARAAYRRSLELEPAQSTTRNNLATLDFESGRLFRAADGMLSALSSDPDQGYYQENLQIVRAKLGACFTALWVLAGGVLGVMLTVGVADRTRLVTGVVWLALAGAITALAWRILPGGVRRSPRRIVGAVERWERLLVIVQVIPLLGVATMAFGPGTVATIAGCTAVAYIVLLTLAIVFLGGDDDE